MQFISPAIYHIAQTTTDNEGLADMLRHIGAPGWQSDEEDGQLLIEVAGKFCYKSFSLDLNPNLRRIRQGSNREYIGEAIIKPKHGSVMEHVQDSYACIDVSRVFTHELVRHRIAGFSQESLRFVRLTELRAYLPTVFQAPFLQKAKDSLIAAGKRAHPRGLEDPHWVEKQLRNTFQRVFEYLEQTQFELTQLLQLDDLDSFGDKKKLTSGMRRLAPIGLATGIIMSANIRTWRHVIEMRTNAAAEEEIRLVFGEIYDDMKDRYPNAFQDAKEETIDGLKQVTFASSKI